jgi:hypothetical protein
MRAVMNEAEQRERAQASNVDWRSFRPTHLSFYALECYGTLFLLPLPVEGRGTFSRGGVTVSCYEESIKPPPIL